MGTMTVMGVKPALLVKQGHFRTTTQRTFKIQSMHLALRSK